MSKDAKEIIVLEINGEKVRVATPRHQPVIPKCFHNRCFEDEVDARNGDLKPGVLDALKLTQRIMRR